MKRFEVPMVEIIRFVNADVMTTSPGCNVDCICVECLPCTNGDHCTYYDTCPTFCARDGQ